MKSFFAALALVSAFSMTASAQDCVTADGATIANGASAKLFYTLTPRQDLGPDYTCAEMSRVRTCVNGTLTNNTPACSQYDSGGCVDFWVDRLADADFALAVCND